MKYLYAPLALIAAGAVTGAVTARRTDESQTLTATLSEWTVRLSKPSVPAGEVRFNVTNNGSIPHAFEIEGKGTERQTPLIQPGESAALTLRLDAGTYEIYCPVGQDSHRKLGMETRLKVVAGGNPASPPPRRAARSRPRRPSPPHQSSRSA